MSVYSPLFLSLTMSTLDPHISFPVRENDKLVPSVPNNYVLFPPKKISRRISL
jgi:hypothetical protein